MKGSLAAREKCSDDTFNDYCCKQAVFTSPESTVIVDVIAIFQFVIKLCDCWEFEKAVLDRQRRTQELPNAFGIVIQHIMTQRSQANFGLIRPERASASPAKIRFS
jgi:hypothetical protein